MRQAEALGLAAVQAGLNALLSASGEPSAWVISSAGVQLDAAPDRGRYFALHVAVAANVASLTLVLPAWHNTTDAPVASAVEQVYPTELRRQVEADDSLSLHLDVPLPTDGPASAALLRVLAATDRLLQTASAACRGKGMAR